MHSARPSLLVRLSHKLIPPKQARTVYVSIDLVASAQAAVDGAATTIMLALDTSRSMHGDGIKAVKDCVRHWIGQLRDQDRLGIVSFGSYPTTILPVGQISELRQQDLEKFIENLRPDGATNLHMALEHAADLIDPTVDRNLRYVLVTDGRPTDVTEPERYRGIAQRLKGQGAVVDCLGIGEDYNEAILSQLVDTTGGLWSHVEDPKALQNVVDYHVRRATQIVDAAQDLHIDVRSGVELSGLYEYRPQIRPLPFNRSESKHVVSVPPLSSGEKRTVVAAVRIDEPEEGRVDLFDVNIGKGDSRRVHITCEPNVKPHEEDAVPRGLFEVSRTQVMAMSDDPAERKQAMDELTEMESDPDLSKLNELRERIERSLTIVSSDRQTRKDIHRAKTVVKVD